MDREKLLELLMDREKLMEIIDSNGRFNLPTVELELLANHLIENGIGDITAEKRKADVAEEALRELIAEMYENGIRPICNKEVQDDRD